MNRRQEIIDLRSVIIQRLTDDGIKTEENTFFPLSSYISIRDKNNPHVRVYLEVPIMYPAEPPKIITYYENAQTSYAYSSFDYNSLANVAIKHFKEPDKTPVSGAAKAVKSVTDHFSDWKEVR